LIGAWYFYDSETSTTYTIAIYWVVCILFLTVFGNYIIYQWLNKLVPWKHDTLKRMIVQLLASGIFTVLCANLSYYLFKTQFTDFPPDNQQMILLNIYAIFIIIPVFSIFFGIYFLTKWKQATIAVEDAKKEIIRSELLTLKNHIDPHFLFNNLNILSSLIGPENKQALAFLEKFSEVYRYVLHNKDTELIILDKELDFLDAYIYLLNTRFEHQVEFEINIPNQCKNYYLPTLSLQMLVENAIKHNVFTKKKKLKIRIKGQEEYLEIRNNFNPKKASESKISGNGSGLRNIAKRYELTTKGKLQVDIFDDIFVVKLPLIKKS
jgi:hypothetical protein